MNTFKKYTGKYPYFLIAVIVWAIIIVGVVVWYCGQYEAIGVELDPQIIELTTPVPTPIPTPTPEPTPTSEPVYDINRADVEMLARLAWGEARGCSTTEQAAVMWCVLNRVDSESRDFDDTIAEVVTSPHQFYYSASFPLEDKLVALAEDVLYRWYKEKDTGEIDGRVLPQEYHYFHGDGQYNYFRDAFRGGTTYDWSLESPYTDDSWME